MHDLEFKKLFPIARWRLNAQAHYMSTACHDAAVSYAANIRRVHALTLIPGHSFMDGEGWKDACNLVLSETPNADPLSEEFGSRAAVFFHKWWWGTDQAEKERHFIEAGGNVDAMWSKTAFLNEALHGLLQTMIIQAWSAFEVLAEDLYKYTLKEELSSIVAFTDKEARKCFLGFASRERIRNTYPYVFKVDNAQISAAISPDTLDALSLVRNVLVHKAGVIDAKFMKAAQAIPQLAYFYNLGLGKDLLLTGTWVRVLVDPVIPIGYELLNVVDRWISAHP